MSISSRALRKRLFSRPRRLIRSWLRPLRASFRPPDYGSLLKRVARLENNVRNVVFAQHPELAREPDQRSALRRSEFRVFSENGEDGILLYLFSKIGTTDQRFVEFGIGDIRKCNSTNLALSFGWTGLLIDGSAELGGDAGRFYEEQATWDPTQVQILESWITPENINATLSEQGFEGEIDLLSVDIDGNDYWVWKAIDVISPRLVIFEYNACLGTDEALVTRYTPMFNRYDLHPLGWYHSCSLPAAEKLGREKGYVLVGCDSSGLNAFFVRQDLAEGRLEVLSAKEAYYPELRRLRIASFEEQYESLRNLPLERF